MTRSAFLSFILIFLAATVSASNITILVGGTGFMFTPANVTAKVGDLVTFIWLSSGHSVTQSSFASPCNLLQDTVNNTVGFDSGIQNVGSSSTDLPSWTLNITNTSPIYFHCSQVGHCPAGMVGSINAPQNGTETFEAFLAAAMATPSVAPTTTLASPTSTGEFVSAGTLSSVPASETTLASTTASTASGTSATNTASTTATASMSSSRNMGGYGNGGSGAASAGVKMPTAAMGLVVIAGLLFSRL